MQLWGQHSGFSGWTANEPRGPRSARAAGGGTPGPIAGCAEEQEEVLPVDEMLLRAEASAVLLQSKADGGQMVPDAEEGAPCACDLGSTAQATTSAASDVHEASHV